MNKILISPSILSADFAYMGENAAMLEKSGADMLHCDVMDGVFVPNLTFGMKMVASLRPLVKIPLDVHLMIVDPGKFVREFAIAGADYLTIHLETGRGAKAALKEIRSLGMKAGISIKPSTPVSALKKYIDQVDLILIMSVEPGFGGQKFMRQALKKLAQARELIGERDIVLQVDGGITTENAGECIAAGATSLVAGNTVFNAPNKAEIIGKLRGGAEI